MTNKNDLLNDTVQDCLRQIRNSVNAIYGKEMLDDRAEIIENELESLEASLSAFIVDMDEDRLMEEAGIHETDEKQEALDEIVRQNCSGLNYR